MIVPAKRLPVKAGGVVIFLELPTDRAYLAIVEANIRLDADILLELCPDRVSCGRPPPSRK